MAVIGHTSDRCLIASMRLISLAFAFLVAIVPHLLNFEFNLLSTVSNSTKLWLPTTYFGRQKNQEVTLRSVGIGAKGKDFLWDPYSNSGGVT